jgi:hypothetical protein
VFGGVFPEVELPNPAMSEAVRSRPKVLNKTSVVLRAPAWTSSWGAMIRSRLPSATAMAAFPPPSFVPLN